MISIININNTTKETVNNNNNNNNDNQQKNIENIENIEPEKLEKIEQEQNHYKNVASINVQNYTQNSTNHPDTNVNDDNVLAQLVHSDEFDVDEGFNEDSASSITSGNLSSIVSNVSSSLSSSLLQSSPSSPASTSPNFNDNLRHNSVKSLLTINGPNGSVRGKRYSVRTRIQNYKELIKLANTEKADFKRNYAKEEKNLCVLYITSMGIIRKTYENCRQLKAILIQHLIRFDERDIYINSNFKTELYERTNGCFELPVLFVNGKWIGNWEVVERLNECGQLINILSNFKLTTNGLKVCDCCGGTKFIPCQTCNGSTKSQIHHFVSDSISLKCSQCRRSGLQKCPKCYTN